MQDLQAKVPGKEVSISNMSEEGQVLFAAYSDKSMGTYYFYDSKTGKLDKLADAAPWIDESKMSDMKPVTYTSRDGLTLHGYLTLPNGAEASGLPLVVVRTAVHGHVTHGASVRKSSSLPAAAMLYCR